MSWTSLVEAWGGKPARVVGGLNVEGQQSAVAWEITTDTRESLHGRSNAPCATRSTRVAGDWGILTTKYDPKLGLFWVDSCSRGALVGH